jgi:hypothetical protein
MPTTEDPMANMIVMNERARAEIEFLLFPTGHTPVEINEILEEHRTPAKLPFAGKDIDIAIG